MKKLVSALVVFALALSVSGCSSEKNKSELVVGSMSGPESELVRVAKQVAKEKYHLAVKVLSFDSYNIPNAALDEGSIDLNVFQHLPFLQAQIEARDYQIVTVGKTFVYPMALYSKHLTTLANLKDGAKIAIPNDPTNEGRALLLLQKAKLIKLRPRSGFQATPLDIVSNPRHFHMVALAGPQLPRSLDDVALAVINTTFASLAGLSTKKDALFVETADSPYANIIVARKKDADNPKIKLFIKAMNSPAVLSKARQLFGGGAIKAW